MSATSARWIACVLLLLVTIGPVAWSAETADTESLYEIVKRSTARFVDPAEATEAGYMAAVNCVTGPEEGAMGIHFVDPISLFDGQLDPERPEALMYEPRNGRLRFVGVEYIVTAEAWHKSNNDPPVLAGQHFHFVGAPNRYRLPAFYELHVWAWKSNPKGTFVDWNPRVSCDENRPEGAAHH